MANIQPDINKIKEAIYGEEVRGSIVNALTKMNTQAAAAQVWVTGADDPGDEPGETNNAKYYAQQAAESAAALEQVAEEKQVISNERTYSVAKNDYDEDVFTQMNGYINYSGADAGTIYSSDSYVLFWFQVENDSALAFNVANTGTYVVLRISDEEPEALAAWTGDLYQKSEFPTMQSPLSVDAGKYVAFYSNEYNSTSVFGVYLWDRTEVVSLADDLELTSAMRVNTDDMIDAKTADYESLVTREDVPDEIELVPNSYITTGGVIKPYNNWSRTDYLSCDGLSEITIENGGASSSTYNVFYDAEKNKVGSNFTVTVGKANYTVPQNAAYFILSGKTSDMEKYEIYTSAYEVKLNDDLPLTTEMSEQVGEMIDARPDTSAGGLVNPNAYIMKTLIPAYYFSRNEEPTDKHDIGYLDDKINSIPDGYHFMFVTDTHWNDNAQQSTKLISYVRDRIGAKYVLFGGDILTAYRTEAAAYRWLCDFAFDFKNAFGSNFLPVVGNHDLNAANSEDPHLLYSDLVPVFTQGCDSRYHYCDYYDDRIDTLKTSWGMSDAEAAAMKQYFRTCYYVDDHDGGVRYIVYNTGAGDGGSGIRQYISSYITGSYEEMVVIEWVYDVLTHTPEGYHVILCTHIPGDFSWSSGNRTFLSDARTRFACMIAGMKAKAYSDVWLPNGIDTYDWWGSQQLYFDFRNAPDVGIVAVIGGHTHVDTFGRYGFTNGGTANNNIRSLQEDVNGTTCTCYQSATVAENSHWRYEVPVILSQHDAYTGNSGPNSHTMTLDTVTEQVIDVVTITPDGNMAFTRIGAGNDRYLTIV